MKVSSLEISYRGVAMSARLVECAIASFGRETDELGVGPAGDLDDHVEDL